jgi:hypothetical protein
VIAEYEKILKARGRNEDDSQPQYWKSTGVAAAEQGEDAASYRIMC